jgi:hypothetical protein
MIVRPDQTMPVAGGIGIEQETCLRGVCLRFLRDRDGPVRRV